MTFGNGAAAHGWFARIASLVADFNVESMKGWEFLHSAHGASGYVWEPPSPPRRGDSLGAELDIWNKGSSAFPPTVLRTRSQ